MRIDILNGPNLNLLGVREPQIYGRQTLADIEAECRRFAGGQGLEITFRQSNHEGQIIDWIQEARASAAGLIINPAGFTSTSIAILDALKMFEGPIVEVHLSNVDGREEWRRKSVVSDLVTARFVGHGPEGYKMALEHLKEHNA